MNKKLIDELGITFSGSVTFNGPMFDIHDNQHVHIGMQMPEAKKQKTKVQETPSEIPSVLETPRAQELWQKLRLAGFVSEDSYMLTSGVSANQAAYIADRMADRLELKRGKWKIFQQLWGIRNMAQLAGSWQQTGKLPPRHKEIDAMI